MNYSINELIEKLPQLTYKRTLAWSAYTKALNNFNRMDAMKRSVFAKVMSYQGGKSDKAKERLALLDGSWLSWLRRYVRAEAKLNKAREEKEITSVNWDCARSLLSVQKIELSSINSYDG